MKVIDLKALVKDCGLRGYFKFKKAELVTLLQNNLQPTPAPAPRTKPPKPTRPSPPPPQTSIWEPIDDRLKPTPPLVRLKPDGPSQWELQPLDLQNSRPYQLKPKRGKETFIEPPVEQKELPPSNQKQIKRMKKKLSKLKKRIRHSKRKHNNLISK